MLSVQSAYLACVTSTTTKGKKSKEGRKEGNEGRERGREGGKEGGKV
jgi:hypothetical protein